MRLWVATFILFIAVTAYADDFVGAERCGTCHEAEYKQWKRSGHATALASLTRVQREDATCRTCHTMVPASEDPALTGVQCESCHGPGRYYEASYIMRDSMLAELNGLIKVEASVCSPCHTTDAPSVSRFKFEEKIDLVRHKKSDDAPAKKEGRN